MAKIFEDEFVQLSIEDNILHGLIYTEHMTLEDARKMVDSRLKALDGKTYPTFIDISRLKSITKEARDYLAEGKAIENLSATAFYANSAVSNLVASFFLSYSKPNLPTKVFSDKNEALLWLKQQNNH
ncbi:MAG: hypothetical protein EOP53_11580 [Sphingobacteriales bacterium]|nr:MAG: hypothetical protein EOP53_11580 [Sphingobacteriales bacterium]